MASIADLRSPASDAAADAILALINAGLWTPTRAGENGKPRRDVGNDNILKPTRLGLEIIKLLPAYAEALWHRCYDLADDSEADAAAIKGWEDATWTLIQERINQASTLVDLAIAFRITAERADPRHYKGAAPWAIHRLACDLALAVLKLAGISEAQCSIMAQRTDWDRHPTPEERRAAIALLEELKGFFAPSTGDFSRIANCRS